LVIERVDVKAFGGVDFVEKFRVFFLQNGRIHQHDP
jgi:hypothetical protein